MGAEREACWVGLIQKLMRFLECDLFHQHGLIFAEGLLSPFVSAGFGFQMPLCW